MSQKRPCRPRLFECLLACACWVAIASPTLGGEKKWSIHDPERPQPRVVVPGEDSKPPSDAIVLFNGKDLSRWEHRVNSGKEWLVKDGILESVPGAGDLVTRDSFGDCQLHIEWATPSPPSGDGAGRANSGVFLMDLYELQILDSFQNVNYADGHAGAVFGQFPPMVNASRPPGQWQSFDVVFRAPRFSQEGQLLHPATLTVLHNGVLVEDHVELSGPTAYKAQPPYEAHGKLPLRLQDHGFPLRFRNIWIRELETSPSLAQAQ